uniref:Uncharacterized protein n=1 Tax=Glossina brevipalpis TaxID=37001 RepID=A0A1A9W3S4_9MUSC
MDTTSLSFYYLLILACVACVACGKGMHITNKAHHNSRANNRNKHKKKKKQRLQQQICTVHLFQAENMINCKPIHAQSIREKSTIKSKVSFRRVCTLAGNDLLPLNDKPKKRMKCILMQIVRELRISIGEIQRRKRIKKGPADRKAQREKSIEFSGIPKKL